VSALSLELSIPASWERIDPTREAVGLLILARFGDGDLRDALAMVSAELLENAIKYSPPASRVGLSITDGDDGVLIAVSNAVDERSAHLPELRERIEWIARFPSPEAAYQAALTRVRADDDRSAAGLGIARVAYEGGCELACDLSVPGRVTVRARCARPA
jgi:hypothetical protein